MINVEQKDLGLEKGLYAVLDTSMGEMVLKLEEEKTPGTVESFVGLAMGEKEYTDPKTGQKTKGHYYDGTIFHRIIKDFMVQGGDPLGQGTGGPGFNIKDEFHPTLKHSGPGILSMANVGRPHTGGGQFFITLVATPWLDNKHAVFGKVVKGVDVLQKMGAVVTGAGDRPKTDIQLKTVRVFRQN